MSSQNSGQFNTLKEQNDIIKSAQDRVASRLNTIAQMIVDLADWSNHANVSYEISLITQQFENDMAALSRDEVDRINLVDDY